MAEKQKKSSHGNGSGQASPRRSDVIRCEKCGEDYAITYKRCPFCDERPGRAGGVVSGGRRVSNKRGGGYGAPVNPLQVIMLVVSLVIIIAAAVIVFRFVSGPKVNNGGQSGSQSSSQSSSASSQSGVTSQAEPAGSGSEAPSGSGSDGSSGTQSVAVESVVLNKSDITLVPNEKTTLTATVTPADTGEAVVWTSSDPSVLTVDQEGNLVNINKTSSQVRVTVTAACGGMKAECVVFCRTDNAGGTPDNGSGENSGAVVKPVAPNTEGTVINAEGGLNIRSGPDRESSVVASATNGSKVTVLGEENGWYKIEYSPGQQGYVSKDYVTVG